MKKLCLAAIVLVLTAGFCSAQQKKVNRELSRLPQPVRKAIRARLGDARLDSVEKNTEDGETTYDVEIVRAGKTRGFTVDETGALLDEEVFVDELPAAAQHTINQHSAGATLDEIDKSDEDGEVSYDVSIERGGRARDFTVDNDGALLEEQVFEDELSPAVRKTISEQAGAHGIVGEINRVADDGETNFDVEASGAGESWNFTVGADGSLIDKEVFLVQLPDALQAAITKQAGTNADLRQCFDDGAVSYEADTDDRTLTFDPDGKLLSTEQDVNLSDTPDAVQAQIKTLTGDGKCLGVTKTTEGDETYYDVDLKTGGQEKEVSIGIDGKIIPDDEN